MLAKVPVWRSRLGPIIAARRVSPEEAEHFTCGAVTWLVAPCLVLGFIPFWGGYGSPHCAGILSSHDVPSAVISIVMLVCSAALLRWTWFRGGA